MTRHLGLFVVLVGLGLLAAGRAVEAGPLDARVNETRAVYKKQGTPLRAQPAKLAQATATLPSGTRVTVLEVKQPWLRVHGAGRSGWLWAAETVEPAALNPNPRPVHTAGAAGAVSQRDVSSAGRQLTAATERGFRATRQDLERAYHLVDAMEAATQALPPTDSVAFIVGGALGRPGQDYQRPALLPPAPPQPAARHPARRPGGISGLLGGLAGEAARRAGVDGRIADTVIQGAEAIAKTGQQLRQNFTPEQEYYLGRAVAANAIAKYGVDRDPKRRGYVQHVGDAMVRLSTRLPANFGGYHFETLDSDEVYAISGPGGFVLLTRGAVEACRTEDELAGILAHELGHVSLKHGEKTLRSGRGFQTLLQGLLQTGASAASVNDERWSKGLVRFFSGIVGEMSRTAMENNYGRQAEFAADLEGTYALMDVVYDHAALRDYLRKLPPTGGARRNEATHPPPQVRAAQLDAVIARYGPFRGNDRVKQARETRLNRELGRAAPAPR